jgi:hypothetical protein
MQELSERKPLGEPRLRVRQEGADGGPCEPDGVERECREIQLPGVLQPRSRGRRRGRTAGLVAWRCADHVAGGVREGPGVVLLVCSLYRVEDEDVVLHTLGRVPAGARNEIAGLFGVSSGFDREAKRVR